MVSNIFEDIANKIKPALGEATVTVSAYAERIIARLDDIVDAVQQDEENIVRKRIPVHLDATSGQTIEIAQVPSDQDWILETLSIECSAATTIRFTDGPNPNPVIYGAKLTTATLIAGAIPPVMFPGGSVITVSNSAGSVDLFMQLKSVRKQPKYRSTNAGQINLATDRDDSRTEASETNRHAGTARFVGENVRGERHREHVL